MLFHKFVKWEAWPLETVMKSTVPAALREYDNGNKKPFQALEICTQNPYFKLGGWAFSLHAYLKRYWVKTKYYGIQEYYAINKTAIRKQLKSDVIEIMEVKAK